MLSGSEKKTENRRMVALLDHVDPDRIFEFSVVFKDHSLNHMTVSFKQFMTDI